MANFAAFGLSNILNVHYPMFLEAHLQVDAPKRIFSYFLGAIFAAQTLTFAFLLFRTFWTYRWAPILSLMAVLGACVMVLPLLQGLGAILLIALPIGVSLGMAYASSIFYSLHGPKLQGLRAGIHEGIVGSGVVLSLAGGWAADLTGDLRWPFWVGAGTVGLSLLVQFWLANKSRAGLVHKV